MSRARSRRRVAFTVALTAIIVAGVALLPRLSLTLWSPPAPDRWRVELRDPGVPPADLEATLVLPVERMLRALPGVIGVETVTAAGTASLILQFENAAAAAEARGLAEGVLATLPLAPAASAGLAPRDEQSSASLELFVSGIADPAALRDWTDDTLVPMLTDIPGLGNIGVDGGSRRVIQVIPDQRRLAALGLSPSTVVEVLTRALRAPRGAAPGSWWPGSAALGAVPVPLAARDSMLLSELARVSAGHEPLRHRLTLNGVDGLRLRLAAAPGSSGVALTEAVKARLAWLETNRILPTEVRVARLSMPAHFVKRVVRNIAVLAFAGLFLAWASVLSAAPGRRAVRRLPVATVAAGVAVALAVALWSMLSGAGPILDPLTAVGLMLAPGLSLAVMLALSSWRVQGWPVFATVLGVAGTILLVVTVAAPSVIPLAIPLVLAIAAALMVIPVGWSAPTRSGQAAAASRPSGGIWRGVGWVAGAALTVAGAAVVWNWAGPSADSGWPVLDDGRVLLDVRPKEPVSALSTSVFEARLDRLATLARQQGEVDDVLVEMRRDPPDAVDDRLIGCISVQLVRDSQRRRSRAQWVADFRQALSRLKFPDVEVAVLEHHPLASDGRQPRLRLRGVDRASVAAQADAVVAHLRRQPGVRDVLSDTDPRPAVLGRLDPVRAAELGVGPLDVARALHFAYAGWRAGSLSEAGRHYEVRVGVGSAPRSDAQLLNTVLIGEVDSHPVVRIGDVAALVRTSLPTALRRVDGQPAVDLRLLPDGTRSEAALGRAALGALASILGPGTTAEWIVDRPDAHGPWTLPAVLLMAAGAAALRHRRIQAGVSAATDIVMAWSAAAVTMWWLDLPPAPLAVLGLALVAAMLPLVGGGRERRSGVVAAVAALVWLPLLLASAEGLALVRPLVLPWTVGMATLALSRHLGWWTLTGDEARGSPVTTTEL